MPSEAPSRDGPAVRLMRPDDAPQLTEILRYSPETVNWLPGPPTSTVAHSGFLLVSESGQHITGFLMARHVADEAEILNVAVHPANRRTGIATQLLLSAIERFRAGNAARLYLEVRESNVPAIAFYQKHAFRQVGRRPNYYRQPDEAALILERKLTG